MKKFIGLGALVSSSIFSLSAFAGDLPIDTQPIPEVNNSISQETPFTWTGFSIGADLGYAWSINQAKYSSSPSSIAAQNITGDFTAPSAVDTNTSSVTGGVHAGYAYQMNSMVFGGELGWYWMNADGKGQETTYASNSGPIFYRDNITGSYFDSIPANFNAINFTATQSTNIYTNSYNVKSGVDWVSLARAKFGYVAGRFLIYGTGGLAFGEAKTSGSISTVGINDISGVGTVQNYSGQDSGVRVGWTLGAGVEAAITNNITARLDYAYYDLGTKNVALTGYDASGLLTNMGTARGEYNGNLLQAGISYKF